MERALAGDVVRWFSAVGNDAERLAESGAVQAATGSPARHRDVLRHRLAARMRAVARQSAEITARGFKAVGSAPEKKDRGLIDIAMTAVDGWIDTQAARRVTRITAQVEEEIRRAIQEGHAAEEGTRAIGRRIRTSVDGMSRARSEMIARTDTHAAAEHGSYEMALASGIDLEKDWGSTEDNRTRRTHAEADGQTVGVFDLFRVGETLLRYPGDPDGSAEEIINCRCVALYRPRGIAR